MKNLIRIIGLTAACTLMTPAHALLISVAGPTSSVGTAATIIAPPASVGNGAVTNTGQQGFTERRGVLLTSDLDVDGGIVGAGLRVDSHMIFLNSPTSLSGISHRLVNWTFDGAILGVMSDAGGLLEEASTALLGLGSVAYPAAFTSRGLEPNTIDNVSLAAFDTLQVTMQVVQPGDWIRVITASQVPEPATLALMLPAALGMAGIGRRKA